MVAIAKEVRTCSAFIEAKVLSEYPKSKSPLRAVVASDCPTVDKTIQDACFPDLQSGLVSKRVAQ